MAAQMMGGAQSPATARSVGGSRIITRSFTFNRPGRGDAHDGTPGLAGADGEAPRPGPLDIATYAQPSPSRPRVTIIILEITASADQADSLISELIGPIALHGAPGDGQQQGGAARQGGFIGIGGGLQGLLATLMDPSRAVHGDAVYTDEAFARIMTQLMEQHPTSNAPGPAPEEAISSLKKKKLDEEMLGPELKGECSVCMDDVTVGDEVIVLPCSHWFHEQCASLWLSEHNSCPICRKAITPDEEAAQASSPSTNAAPSPPAPIRTRSSGAYAFLGGPRSSRNESRLQSIRDAAEGSSSARENVSDESSRNRFTIIGDSARTRANHPSPPPMPGAFRARQDSDGSEGREYGRRLRTRPSGSRSGSDQSRRQSNGSGNSGGSSNGGGGGGPFSWIRDHIPGRRNN